MVEISRTVVVDASLEAAYKSLTDISGLLTTRRWKLAWGEKSRSVSDQNDAFGVWGLLSAIRGKILEVEPDKKVSH
jgi:hypothetical protein